MDGTTGAADTLAPLEAAALDWRTVAVLSLGCGLTVANLYYSQPLLPQIGATLGATDAQTGFAAALTQAGYALGILLFVPLGDSMERRRLIITMLCAVTVALVGIALAPGVQWFAAASFILGLTAITPQLLIPLAAHLAKPAERGRVLGTVMSGLLIGVLLSRTISGVFGAYIGWRGVYAMAAVLMVGLILTLRAMLPSSQPHSRMTYLRLQRSLLTLFREEPVLRESCLFGATSFAAFGAFWTTLAFFVAEEPYGYGSGMVGLFSLIGVGGALFAPVVGRLGDRRSPRLTIGLGIVLKLLSFLVLWLAGQQLWGLIVGVIIFDLGAQAIHISNQTRIYSLRPEARSRFNTVYMVCFFIGGWVGSSVGTYAWHHWGWSGVCAVGGISLSIAALRYCLPKQQRQAE